MRTRMKEGTRKRLVDVDVRGWVVAGMLGRGGITAVALTWPCGSWERLQREAQHGAATLPHPPWPRRLGTGWKMAQHRHRQQPRSPGPGREGGAGGERGRHSWIPVTSRGRARGFQNRPWSGARMLPAHVSKARSGCGAGPTGRWRARATGAGPPPEQRPAAPPPVTAPAHGWGSVGTEGADSSAPGQLARPCPRASQRGRHPRGFGGVGQHGAGRQRQNRSPAMRPGGGPAPAAPPRRADPPASRRCHCAVLSCSLGTPWAGSCRGQA